MSFAGTASEASTSFLQRGSTLTRILLARCEIIWVGENVFWNHCNSTVEDFRNLETI